MSKRKLDKLENCQHLIQKILKYILQKEEVIIEVDNGFAKVIECPKNITVIIKDKDFYLNRAGNPASIGFAKRFLYQVKSDTY